jgi:hypothetical protein
VAILAEQRLDRGQQRRMPDGLLAGGRAVQHLVAELVAVRAAALGRQRREGLLDLAREPRDQLRLEHARQHRVAVAFELRARGRRGARAQREVAAEALDHGAPWDHSVARVSSARAQYCHFPAWKRKISVTMVLFDAVCSQ